MSTKIQETVTQEKKLHNQRVVVSITALNGIFGCFLPWSMRHNGSTNSGLEGYWFPLGYIFIFFYLVAILIVIANKENHKKPLKISQWISVMLFSGIPGIASIGIIIGDGKYTDLFGLYWIALSFIALTILLFVFRKKLK